MALKSARYHYTQQFAVEERNGRRVQVELWKASVECCFLQHIQFDDTCSCASASSEVCPTKKAAKNMASECLLLQFYEREHLELLTTPAVSVENAAVTTGDVSLSNLLISTEPEVCMPSEPNPTISAVLVHDRALKYYTQTPVGRTLSFDAAVSEPSSKLDSPSQSDEHACKTPMIRDPGSHCTCCRHDGTAYEPRRKTRFVNGIHAFCCLCDRQTHTLVPPPFVPRIVNECSDGTCRCGASTFHRCPEAKLRLYFDPDWGYGEVHGPRNPLVQRLVNRRLKELDEVAQRTHKNLLKRNIDEDVLEMQTESKFSRWDRHDREASELLTAEFGDPGSLGCGGGRRDDDPGV